MTEREVYEKFANLSKKDLNNKIIKAFTSEILS